MGNLFSKRPTNGAGGEEFDNAGLTRLHELLTRKAVEWKEVPITFAMIGQSRTGKSSLINTIRGLRADDPGAAPVGVNETLKPPIEYAHPTNPLLTYWDLPGVGTPNFPRKTYLKKINFEKYDFFLLVSRDTFTEDDLWLAQEIRKRGKQFFYLRTKIDHNIDDDKSDYPDTHDPQCVLRTIRENVRSNLGDLYDEKSVFLINNHDRSGYDFPRLGKRLIKAFPAAKRTAFVLSMSAWSESMVRSKIATLRTMTCVPATLSGLVGVIPLPIVSLATDFALVVGHCRMYFETLGLDEDSMRRRSAVGSSGGRRQSSCDLARLEQIVEDARNTYLTYQGIANLIRSAAILMAGEVAEQVVRWVPILGSVLAAAISAGSMIYILNRILDELEVIALTVVRADVDSSSRTIDEEEEGGGGDEASGSS